MDNTSYQPSSKFPKRSVLMGGIFFVLIASVGIGATVYLSSRDQTSDTRSQAALNDTATIEVVKSETDQEFFADIYVDVGQLQNTQVRSFETTVVVDSAVLGLTTQHIDRTKDLQQLRQSRTLFEANGAKGNSSVPKGMIKVCLDEVVQNGSQLSWKTTCKGDTAKGNCTSSSQPLTAQEALRYDAWVDLKKNAASRCVFVPDRGTTANPRPANVATTTPQSNTVIQTTPPPTASVSPTPEPVLLTQVGSVSVYKAGNNPFQYSPAVINQTPEGFSIVLTGKVENSQQQALLRNRVFIGQIRIKKTSPIQKFNARLSTQSLKGVKAIAPNVEVELLKESTEQPSSTTTPQK